MEPAARSGIFASDNSAYNSSLVDRIISATN